MKALLSATCLHCAHVDSCRRRAEAFFRSDSKDSWLRYRQGQCMLPKALWRSTQKRSAHEAARCLSHRMPHSVPLLSPLPQDSPPNSSGRSAGTGSSCVYAFAADACPHGRQAHSQWMPQPAAYTYHSSSLHRNACIFFKKTYSPTSRLAYLPQKRATRCCCGKFLLELRHAAEIFRGGEPAPQPKDFHDQRPRNPSDRDPKFRRTEPEAFQTQDPRLCPRKDGYCP